ncbi:MAG TPA: protein kinase, partial [Thermoanaerobaculia bacterium]
MGHLGSGGMGEVYLAQDTRLGRKVALKVPPADLSHEPLQLARFQHEAQALAAINHPNIVTIYSVEEHDGLPFLAMELVEGRKLTELIPPHGMGLGQLLDVAVQLADGLAAAHEHGVLHRDLKPGNIMVNAAGRVTILDFGIAKRLPPTGEAATILGEAEPLTQERHSVGEAEPLTQEGNIVGTLSYMSPEQIRRQALAPGSDLFSLGIVLYQMATGFRPFRGADAAEEMLAILELRPRPPHAVRPELDPRLDEIVLRCLEKDPPRRYASARALRHDLASLLHELNPASRSGTVLQSDRTQEAPLEPTELEVVPNWRPTSGARSADLAPRTAAAPAGEGRSPGPLRTVGAGAALALLLAAGGWYVAQGGRRSGGAPAAARPAISALAVLPLHTLSAEPEYFADGMTEALITSLGNLGHVRVISRQSVMRYKDSEKPLPSIASELGVDVVLTGTVTRSGERLRITTQLVRAEPEQQLWTAIFNRDARDVLALQDDVAREVAHQVQLELTDQEKARLSDARRVDPAVYDLYLQGRFHWNKRTPEELHQAIKDFRKAIAADPTYAPAYAGLADSYILLGVLGYEPREQSFRQAKAAASRALALDGSLADAHASLGLVTLNFDWDGAGAERAFRKALELNPSSANAHQWLAGYLISVSRFDEAAQHLDIARQLNPFSPTIVANTAEYALIRGDYDRAVEQARKVIELEPRLALAHEQLWFALHAKDRPAEAFAEFQQTLSLSGYPEAARHAARVYAKSGYRPALLAACDHLERSRPGEWGGWLIAEAASLAGDRDRAIAWLEKAVEQRNPYVRWIGQLRQWDALRGDRRFEALVRRVHTPAADAAARRSTTPAPA